MEISGSSTDDQHMSEATPLSKEPENFPDSPSREGAEAPTSAAELQRLRYETHSEAEPGSPMTDIVTTPPAKADNPHTASWLESAALDQAKGQPNKAPVEDLPSDPRKLSLMDIFDRHTGIDPTKS